MVCLINITKLLLIFLTIKLASTEAWWIKPF